MAAILVGEDNVGSDIWASQSVYYARTVNRQAFALWRRWLNTTDRTSNSQTLFLRSQLVQTRQRLFGQRPFSANIWVWPVAPARVARHDQDRGGQTFCIGIARGLFVCATTSAVRQIGSRRICNAMYYSLALESMARTCPAQHKAGWAADSHRNHERARLGRR